MMMAVLTLLTVNATATICVIPDRTTLTIRLRSLRRRPIRDHIKVMMVCGKRMLLLLLLLVVVLRQGATIFWDLALVAVPAGTTATLSSNIRYVSDIAQHIRQNIIQLAVAFICAESEREGINKNKRFSKTGGSMSSQLIFIHMKQNATKHTLSTDHARDFGF